MQDMMLKTPTAMDSTEATARMKSSQTKDGSMHSVTLARAVHTLLPTPVASDSKGGVSCVQGARAERPGLLTLADMASLCLLPTPLAVSVRHPGRVSELRMAGDVTFCSRAVGETRPNGLEDWLQFHGLKKRTGKGQERMHAEDEDFVAMFPENGGSQDSKDGRASQLNPLFVGEMMGYPLEWLTSPFLLGDGEGRP